MKFFIIFALALSTVSAFDLRNAELKLEKEGRITNGHNATNGQFPYQVGMDLEKADGSTYVCGGSIISEEYVLTAAHCLVKAEKASVYFGTTSFTDIGLEVSVDKENFIIHEEYIAHSSLNDIAVIKVPHITYNDNTQAVALPAISDSYSNYVGDEVIATGWGHTFTFSGPTQDLQWASLKVIENSECRKLFGGNLLSSHLCASGKNGTSTCNGDSGGPLVLADSNTQIGVLSYGTGICTRNDPDVFTRITSYLAWISSKTGIVL